MRKHNRKNRFTLVELLVSLGVFSVLLVVFMQIFSGMRLIWTNSEKETDVSNGARVAMDVLSVLLSAAYYSTANDFAGSERQFLFYADQAQVRPGGLYFAARTSYDLPGSNPIRFIGVQLPTAALNYGLNPSTQTDRYHKLQLTVLSNEDTEYPRFSPEFMNASNQTISTTAAREALYGLLTGKLRGADGLSDRIELLGNVTDFQVRALDKDGNQMTEGNSKPIPLNCYAVPDTVELSISVLTDENFAAWVTRKGGIAAAEDAAARKFRLEKQKTFTRRIRIDSHNQLVENEI